MESPDMVDDATVEDDDTVEQDTESPNVLEMGDTGIGNAGIDTAEMDNAGMDSAEMHNPGEVLIDENLDPIDEEMEEDDGAIDVNGEEIPAPVDPEMEAEEDLALSDSDVALINQLFSSPANALQVLQLLGDDILDSKLNILSPLVDLSSLG